MSLRGYVRKTRPAPWTTTPAEVAARKERAALKDARDRAGRMAKRLNWKRIAPVSKSRRSALAEYRREARLFVATAVALGCTCPVVDGVPALRERRADNRLTEVHHVRGRSGGLLLDRRWWLAVSAAGHDWVHTHPAEAAERGWLAGMGEWLKSDKSRERKTQIDVATDCRTEYSQGVNR
jgi:hypothetical protein